MGNLKKVDHSALRVNQAAIIALLLAGFVLNAPAVVGLVSVVMLAGSLLLRRPGFFWLYTGVLRPLGWVRPDVIEDHPEPHLFAQGFGGTVLLASAAALLVGAPGLGWALTWLVIALAALNLLAGFCAGCFVYYWLNRLRVPGFNEQAPAGTTPGFRPRQPFENGGARHAGK